METAIAYYQKAISLGNLENIDEELKRAYKSIAEACDLEGNFEQASLYKSKYMVQTELLSKTNEMLQEENTQYRMKEVEWQRELMQKEVLLASAEKENVWGRIIIGVALPLILYCSRLIYVYYRKIAKARKIVNSYSVTYLNL